MSTQTASARSPLLVYFLLGGMMFLEYAVWGAWMPVLSGTLDGRGVPPVQIGYIYSTLWLACIISPFIGGQLVDRLMPSQWFLALTHLLAAIVAFWTAQQTSVTGLLVGMFAWSLLFAPSLGITNSIAFFQIGRTTDAGAKSERVFAIIRTLGSIGWIAAAFLRYFLVDVALPDKTGKTGPISELLLAGILGIVMALFALALPHTPPTKVVASTRGDDASDPLAFVKALRMFKTVPGFAVFMLISFIAATEFQFFYLLSAPFLEDLKIPNQMVPIVKSISQVTEILALSVLLPLWLPSKGMKWCLLIGSFAWPLRYVIFALQKPLWLVVASLGLHGFGYAFVLVVQQLYVDRVAPRDIRASAQSLLTLVTLGVGNFLGTLFCGMVQQMFTANGVTNWPPVFILPAVLTLICAFAYWATFKDSQSQGEPAAVAR
ncbi:MAG: MFS transporter [Armatimonadota bacterium]